MRDLLKITQNVSRENILDALSNSPFSVAHERILDDTTATTFPSDDHVGHARLSR